MPTPNSVGQIFIRKGMVDGTGRLFLQQIMHYKLIVEGILFFVVRMALQKTFLNGFCCPHGPTENIFEQLLAVRMALPKTFWCSF